MSLTDSQKKHIRDSWAKVYAIKIDAGKLFYSILFEAHPEVKPMFKRDVGDQANMLMDAVNVVIASLDDVKSVIPVLESLGKNHASYGVKDVGAAFLQTLEKGLGEAFTAEVKEAWATAYGVISSVMKAAAKKADN